MSILFKKIGKTLTSLGFNINFANNVTVDSEYISTIQTCIRILVENVSRMPIIVRNKEGIIINNHIISNSFNKQFNNYISADTGRKLIERDRVSNGNGFIRLYFDNKGGISKIVPYPYESVIGIILKNDNLYYALNNKHNPYVDNFDTENVNGNEMLHLKTPLQSEFLGISPLSSLKFEVSIKQKASETLENFYNNNAMSPVTLTSSINDMSQVKVLKEFLETFKVDNVGSGNAGKVIKLPPMTKLEALNFKMVDADVVPTLKFTNEQIISAFSVPSFLMSYQDGSQDVENQTLEFKSFTLNNILYTYKNEIEMKMLTAEEKSKGYYIDWDFSVMMEASLETKADAYQKLATNGLLTPNESILRLGMGTPIKGGAGDKHWIQSQYIALEDNKVGTLEENKQQIK